MAPRPLQKAVAQVLDELGDAPGLIVIEAPMGEGKTEAGLASSCGSRGLYMAMPTQATANALLGRVSKHLVRAGDGLPVQVALAHGAGGPSVAAARLREIGLGTRESSVQAGWWFRGSKRALLCPNGIGTVDQSLIGVLNAQHWFVRQYGLSQRTVVFDELHAYDAYTGGLIERLIAWLQALNCRVVLMSATLPAATRESILRTWAGDIDVPVAKYPRVSWAVPGLVRTTGFAASRQQHVEVNGLAHDVPSVARAAEQWAAAGARVLVVVNKVVRAQELFQALPPDVGRTLFHARFPMDQRLQIEQQVLAMFGPGGSARDGQVLVATQVAEQSLDVDFDVLITDVAPIDLVLQREGRIHRHLERPRPAGFEQPVVYVAGLSQTVPPEELSSYVYDQWLVLRSAAWLRGNPVLRLPDDIDRGVQEVYGGGPLGASGALEAAIEAALPQHLVDEARMVTLSSQAALPAPGDWSLRVEQPAIDDALAEDGGLRFGTRLGDDSASVVPVFPSDGANLERLVNRYMRVSRRQLLQHVRAAVLPPGWCDVPGLAHHFPLHLDNQGMASVPGIAVRLDPVLGLVIG
ncbi:CRISPR-associated helicase Cas3' [Synechococcus sp. J7-Johnson]|uniref:CRISPR-associated helicase Cas3' n=1 Tax=Synechococcus sp. J7-Johnson TaxID=2823737 RepID=UPI0020CE4533|nr:CRISPR-associated helicase Cas3' [Synechococcus sp. J7-Johnson]MCP9841742.1 CRISPR-associated helicase Cas3' [Synechococcus sp. J7-Johnson]